MTGLSAFQPGGELTCTTCPFITSGRDGDAGCQIALELACVNEPMSARVCPQPTRSAHSPGIRRRHAQRVRYDATLGSWRASAAGLSAATP